MKFYVAAKFESKQEVRKLYDLLKSKGHEITVDWTLHKAIKPYKENQELAKQYASEDINGLKDCDVFIIIGNDYGKGLHAELGAAILSNILFQRPLIYAIGEHNTKCMFYFHPSIKRKKDINEVLKEIK